MRSEQRKSQWIHATHCYRHSGYGIKHITCTSIVGVKHHTHVEQNSIVVNLGLIAWHASFFCYRVATTDQMRVLNGHIVILITHSYFLNHDAKQLARMTPYSPLSTLIAAARLRDDGHAVEM